MNRNQVILAGAGLALAAVLSWTAAGAAVGAEWAMNATTIEACSCPMFCQCYFGTKTAGHSHDGHGSEHFCRFNMAYKVNRGHAAGVKLDGARFWIAGDLGADFGGGETDWATVHFDPAVAPEQRAAIATVLGHVYPVKWKSFKVAEDAKMTWSASDDEAVAKLDDGKTAEVVLKRTPGMTDEPVVIHNLRYWGVPRHDGFVLMPNEVEAWRGDDRAFEYRGTNGFMITLDIGSEDVAAPAAAEAAAGSE